MADTFSALIIPAGAEVEPKARDEPRESPYRLECRFNAKSGRGSCKGRKPCNGTLISKGELRLGVVVQFGSMGEGTQFRHWGCVTERQLQNMAKEFQSADKIEGFDDLLEEDKLRVTQALQNGEINIEDMSELAPPRKGVVRAAPKAEEDDPDLAKAKDDDEYRGKATPTAGPIRKTARKSRKNTAYTDEDEELELKKEVDVDVKPLIKKKRGRSSKTSKIEDAKFAADEDVNPDLKKTKSELPQASQTASGSRRVRKKKSARENKEDVDPQGPSTDEMLKPAEEEKKPKMKKERKLKEIQPGPIVDANGFPVRRSARQQLKAEQ